MKRIFNKTNLLLIPWIGFIIALGYFILINTAFGQQRLAPNLAQVLGLEQENELNNIVFSLTIDGFEHKFSLHQIAFPDWQNRLNAYGKGADFLQVISQGLASITDTEQVWDLVIDKSKLANALPVSPGQTEFVRVEQGGWLSGCTSNLYDLQLNSDALHRLISDSLVGNKDANWPKINTSWSNISSNPQIESLFSACQQYKSDLEKIYNKFSAYADRSSLEYIFGYVEPTKKWELRRTEPLVKILEQHKSKSDIAPASGEYQKVGNKIYLYQPYRVGKELLIADSIKAISDWVSNIDAEINFAYKDIQPEVLGLGLEIYDFTKLVSTGATRIDLIRNGAYNANADFVVYGLEGIQDTVVMPGKQFSYIDTANPDRGRFIKNGRPVGNGFCMATTTIFRAALEGGFPITERSQHGYNFASYAWSENGKYPYNIVDAAYYTSPEIDMKFVNNTSYPILIRATAKREDDGYQYNHIRIYSSSQSPTREVSLVNWQILSDRGKGAYGQRISGSFERIVKENGNVILQDKYYSNYR